MWRKANGAMYKIRAVSASPVRGESGSARHRTPRQLKSAGHLGRPFKGRVWVMQPRFPLKCRIQRLPYPGLAVSSLLLHPVRIVSISANVPIGFLPDDRKNTFDLGFRVEDGLKQYSAGCIAVIRKITAITMS
jgi:hypothetical protein